MNRYAGLLSILLVAFATDQFRRAVRTRYDTAFQTFAGALALLAAVSIVVVEVMTA